MSKKGNQDSHFFAANLFACLKIAPEHGKLVRGVPRYDAPGKKLCYHSRATCQEPV
jgi:hypothetical protein